MKKLLCMLAALLLLASCACAESVMHYVPELNMVVNLPDSFVILTRETGEDEYAAYGMDKTAVMEFLTANDTYMIILPPDFGYEIDVAMAANPLSSFNDYGEEDLKTALPEVYKSLEAMGLVIDAGEVYTNGRDQYMRLFYHVPGDTITYAVQYYTVQNYQTINFRLFTYGAEATDEMLAEFESVMENVIFN